MRQWLVRSALIENENGLLLVANRRRDERLDWTPPGGVIDEGEDVLGGLTREVEEETGLRVTAWDGPVYLVDAEAVDAGWHMKVEVFRAITFEGDLRYRSQAEVAADLRSFHGHRWEEGSLHDFAAYARDALQSHR